MLGCSRNTYTRVAKEGSVKDFDFFGWYMVLLVVLVGIFVGVTVWVSHQPVQERVHIEGVDIF